MNNYVPTFDQFLNENSNSVDNEILVNGFFMKDELGRWHLEISMDCNIGRCVFRNFERPLVDIIGIGEAGFNKKYKNDDTAKYYMVIDDDSLIISIFFPSTHFRSDSEARRLHTELKKFFTSKDLTVDEFMFIPKK